MALPDNYIQVYGELPSIMKRYLKDRPLNKFTRQYLKDIGFSSANYHALIPFVEDFSGSFQQNGTPTSRYH